MNSADNSEVSLQGMQRRRQVVLSLWVQGRECLTETSFLSLSGEQLFHVNLPLAHRQDFGQLKQDFGQLKHNVLLDLITAKALLKVSVVLFVQGGSWYYMSSNKGRMSIQYINTILFALFLSNPGYSHPRNVWITGHTHSFERKSRHLTPERRYTMELASTPFISHPLDHLSEFSKVIFIWEHAYYSNYFFILTPS